MQNEHTETRLDGGASVVDRSVRPCDEPCQKCGSTDIYRRFIARGAEVPHESYDKCASKYGTGMGHSWRATRDHMQHQCRCCGFAWQGLPMKKRKAWTNASGNQTARQGRSG